MAYIFRTLVVPASLASDLGALCFALAGDGGAGMFTDGASPSGLPPATHFFNTGPVEDAFGPLLSDPTHMAQACAAAGRNMAIDECANILRQCDVTDQPLDGVLKRMGLKIIERNAHG